MSAFARFGVLTGLLLTVISARIHAATVFSDDFEGYANQAAFAGTWSMDGAPPHLLDTAFGRNSNQSVRLIPQPGGGGTTNRWYRDLPTPVLPTDAAPVLFSFDFYLDPAGAASSWAADWQLVDVRAFSGGSFGAGGLSGIIALGVSRTGNSSFFQGRVHTPGHSAYHDLSGLPMSVPRSSGWHTLAARIGATETRFSVDGLPAAVVNFGITTPISTVIIGSDISSIRPFWADNIRLERVPEPAAISILAIAAFFVAHLRGARR